MQKAFFNGFDEWQIDFSRFVMDFWKCDNAILRKELISSYIKQKEIPFINNAKDNLFFEQIDQMVENGKRLSAIANVVDRDETDESTFYFSERNAHEMLFSDFKNWQQQFFDFAKIIKKLGSKKEVQEAALTFIRQVEIPHLESAKNRLMFALVKKMEKWGLAIEKMTNIINKNAI